MEYLIVSSILGLGYIYQNNNKSNNFKQSKKSKIPNSERPNSYNYYTDHRSYNIWQSEQKKANKLMQKSKFPQDTNIVTPGPPYPIINNKVDYEDKKLPIDEINAFIQKVKNRSTEKETWARDVGTNLHEYIDLYLKGQKPALPESEPLLSMVNKWKNWWVAQKFEVVLSETRCPSFTIKGYIEFPEGLSMLYSYKEIYPFGTPVMLSVFAPDICGMLLI